MNPGAVLFPAMYDMWVVMLKSLECGCLSIIGLQRDDDDEGGGENHSKVGTRWVRQPTENHESLARCDGGTCKQHLQQQRYDASAAQLFPAEPPLMDNSLLRPAQLFSFSYCAAPGQHFCFYFSDQLSFLFYRFTC